MNPKRTIVLLLSLLISSGIAYAFSNCMGIYNNHPRAIPKFKNDCSICHQTKSGGGPQNAFGRAFADAGFMITNKLITDFPDFFLPDEEPEDTADIEPILPTIKRIAPKKIKANVDVMIKIKGENFVNGSTVLLNNEKEFVTIFKSDMLLITDIFIETGGTHTLKVKTPDGQESNEANLKVKEPKK